MEIVRLDCQWIIDHVSIFYMKLHAFISNIT